MYLAWEISHVQNILEEIPSWDRSAFSPWECCGSYPWIYGSNRYYLWFDKVLSCQQNGFSPRSIEQQKLHKECLYGGLQKVHKNQFQQYFHCFALPQCKHLSHITLLTSNVISSDNMQWYSGILGIAFMELSTIHYLQMELIWMTEAQAWGKSRIRSFLGFSILHDLWLKEPWPSPSRCLVHPFWIFLKKTYLSRVIHPQMW